MESRWSENQPTNRALSRVSSGGCCNSATGHSLASALSSSASLLHQHRHHHPRHHHHHHHRARHRQHQQHTAKPTKQQQHTPPPSLPFLAWRRRQRCSNGPCSASRSPRSSPRSSICPRAHPGSTAACVSSVTTLSAVRGDWLPPVVLLTGEFFLCDISFLPFLCLFSEWPILLPFPLPPLFFFSFFFGGLSLSSAALSACRCSMCFSRPSGKGRGGGNTPLA